MIKSPHDFNSSARNLMLLCLSRWYLPSSLKKKNFCCT